MPSIYNQVDRLIFRGQIDALKTMKDDLYGDVKMLSAEINHHYELMKVQGISKEEKSRIYQKIQAIKEQRSAAYQQIERIKLDLEGLYLALRM